MRKFRLLLTTCALLASSSIFAQQVPADGTSYYLYNVESGKFLTRGSNWGTKAVTNDFGSPWQVSIADGKYTLRMLDIVSSNSTKGFGSNSFSDNDNPVEFTLTGDANGYKITDGTNYITSPDTYGADMLVAQATGKNTWQFLNVTEYKAILAAKTKAQEEAVATAAGISLGDGTLAAVVNDQNTWRYLDKSASVPFPSNTSWEQVAVSNRKGNANEGTYGVERYQGGGTYSYKVTGLAKGLYKVGIKAMFRSGNNEVCSKVGDAGFVNSSAYLSANGNLVQIKDWYSDRASATNPNSTGDFVNIAKAGGYLSEVFAYVGDDGELELKAVSESYWGGSWFLFNGIVLTYYSTELAEEDAAALIATIPTEPYNAAIKQTVNEAKAAVEATPSVTNYNALAAAIEQAKASVEAYAKIPVDFAVAKAIYEHLEAGKADDAIESYANVAAVITAYEECSIEDKDAEASAAKVSEWISTNVMKQTMVGAEFTRGILNADCTANNNAGWTIEGGNTFHTNTWSTENDESGLKVPFIEDWVGGGKTLADATISHVTVEGLPAGKYAVSGFIRAFAETHEDVTPTGACIFANGIDGEDVSTGTFAVFVGSQSNSGEVYGTYTVRCEVGDDGQLTFGIKVKDANEFFDWIAFKNFTVVLEDLPTAISEVAKKATAKSVFNVAGQQIKSLQKGLNIVDGKKVYVK